MKIEREAFTVDSNMAGEKVAMAIRTEDSVHLMGLLTDLYEDRLYAIIREYSTNASDAHVAAGISLPIEVTLPSSFTPVLTIRDYGTGLDQADIAEIYSQYGASTKRGGNEQQGMFGIGCKSGLTYTNQFTVQSIKDGRKIIVLVSRDEDGAGSMQTLSNEPTDEANGTQIQVSIRREDIHTCAQKAANFFAYWADGTVLVNGNPPTRFNGLRITDSLFIIESPNADKIVMGNVPYPVTLPLGQKYRRFSVVAFVPTGTVRPTPSREGLMDTRNTVAALEKIAADYPVVVKGAIQREIDKCDSPHDAVRMVIQWAKYLDGPNVAAKYTYKGIPIPTGFEPANGDQIRTVDFRGYGHGKNKAYDRRDWPISQWPSTVWVSNYLPEKFTAQHRAKLAQWCEENKVGQDGSISTFTLLPCDAPASKFINPAYVVAWETIKKVKLPAKPSGNYYGSYKAIPGSYSVYTEAGFTEELAGADIRQDQPLFWVQSNKHNALRYQPGLAACYPKFTLVCLAGNRIAKFKRDAPAATPVNDALTAGYVKWVKTISPLDLKALAYQDTGSSRRYASFDATKINDPAIKNVIEMAKRDVTAIRQARDAFRHLVPMPEFSSAGGTPDPLMPYALLNNRYGGWSHRDLEHLYLYLNAAYAAGLVK